MTMTMSFRYIAGRYAKCDWFTSVHAFTPVTQYFLPGNKRKIVALKKKQNDAEKLGYIATQHMQTLGNVEVWIIRAA